MTFVGVTSLIVFYILCSTIRSNQYNLRKISFTKNPQFSTLPDLRYSTPVMCYITADNCYVTHFPTRKYASYSNAPPYALNKRELNPLNQNYVQRRTFESHPARLNSPIALYEKSVNQNLNPSGQRSFNYNYFIRDSKSIPTRLLGTLNATPIRKKYLLQSINNPYIYDILAKRSTQFIESTTRTSKLQDTRRTNSNLIVTAPYNNNHENTSTKKLNVSTNAQHEQWNFNMYNNYEVMAEFMQALDSLERKFYKVTFAKLTTISPADRTENGISFAQTGLFLQLALLAISSEVNTDTREEIEECIGLELTDTEKIYVLKEIMSSLPKSNEALKFRTSSRLVLGVRHSLKPQFLHGLAPAKQLHIDRINTNDTTEALTATLNRMIEKDSGGAMHDTFEEEELSEGICAVLLSTMYLRARWRSAPTVLNGTHAFLDAENAPPRTMRMIRINDIMRYTELNEWDAEAVEVFYATPGLSLLIVLPRGRSLRKLSGQLAETSIHSVLERMYTLRVAVNLPLYTLRMTLLLPGKLEAMGIKQLVDIKGGCDELKLSHAVQRLMFWSEAGRNAYKDDGIEWDEAPELELFINRPYIFFVRWRNITLMNGHFVL
ncbi:serpin I2-like [Battus philenor]|uniref:serpin I2-like n=1 Tax=Battus philenor TaxID=42288 RepID=UPI0035D0BD2A